MINDEPDYIVIELFKSPCGRIFIADGYSNLDIYDTFTGNKVYDCSETASVPLLLTSDILIFQCDSSEDGVNMTNKSGRN